VVVKTDIEIKEKTIIATAKIKFVMSDEVLLDEPLKNEEIRDLKREPRFGVF
jgi:hypothetical protein